MVKIVTLIKRKAGMSKEDFSEYWANVHAPLAMSEKGPPGFRRYAQVDRLRTPVVGEAGFEHLQDAEFDGIAEMWFDDWDSLNDCLTFFFGDEGKAVREDMDKFVDLESAVMYFGEDRVIKGF
jgi:uncharacterized protein (TIGR02118 family)